MNNIEKSLTDIFGLPMVEAEKPLDVAKIEATQEEIDSQDAIKEYASNNIIELIERGKTAIEQLGEIAKDTEKSRDYEVLLNGIKNIAEINERLIGISAKPEKSKEVEAPQQITNNTAVFVGSTADLQRMIKQQMVIDNKESNNE